MASSGRLRIIPIDGGEPRELEGLATAAAFSPDGRRVAAGPLDGPGLIVALTADRKWCRS